MGIEVPVGQIRRRRPGRAAVRALAVLGAAATALGGCAAGQDAQTAYQKPTLDGVRATVGRISLNGLTIKAPTTTFYAKGSSAAVRLVLVNSGTTADTLTGVTSTAFSGWGVFSSAAAAQAAQATATATSTTSVNPTSGASPAPTGTRRVPLPANARVPFGTPEATSALLFTKLSTPLHPAASVPITFTFAKAGAVTVQVPVGLTSNPSDSVIPTPSASSSASDSA